MTPEQPPTSARPNGPGTTVWLASYPKSGNTWMRAIVTALGTHRHLFGVNQLGSGAQPNHVGGIQGVFGIDPRWLSRDEIDRMRTVLTNRWGAPPDAADSDTDTDTDTADDAPPPPLRPVLRKTHEVYRPGAAGREPFPLAATRGAILVVRDPRDVACSYAPFFGVDLDGAINAMAREGFGGAPSPAMAQTEQPWGTWSSHAASWLADDVPFPVHLVRYEDLKADTVGTLRPVFEAIGLECTPEQLAAAAEQSRFDRLQKSEAERGFRETSKQTRTFFRKGKAGGWADELSEAQVAAVEADHDDMMVRLGYDLTTEPAARSALAESRASRRRAERFDWMRLPEAMALDVRHDSVPDEIADAKQPRPWIHVNDRQVLVVFSGGTRLLVEDGKTLTVDWTPDPDRPLDDPSWLVQGWGVTLAMLQRGDLSLHAATVQIGDQIVAIAGHRGAGKSTTSMALRKRGHRLLVDDVTLIEFRGDEAWTTPYARNVHLLPDAAEALGVDFDALPMLAGGRTKVAFRAEAPDEQPHRIDRVVVLAPGPNVEEVTLAEARGGQKLATLLGHTRRDGIAPLILGQARYFELMTQLSNAVPVQVLRRPRGDWTLDEVLDLIEGDIAD
ncbi:MAG: sulfotransferase domain-containing protein [Candidatus Nanopelagicales bacterium]